MEATTYTLGYMKVRLERERIAGVLVVHEVHEHAKGGTKKNVWYVEGSELLQIRDMDRAPFRAECKSREEVERLVRKMNLTLSLRR